MVQPLIEAHPAADRVTAAALVVEQERAVVGLSPWLADAAVTAGRTGRALQVVTPASSRITYPVELLLGEGAGWVVRDGAGHRDGLTGAPMEWTGERFVASGDAGVPAAAEPGRGDLEVVVTLAHAATAATEVGGAVAVVCEAVGGGAPRGWGVAEPASQPWSPRELTRFCRERAPAPSSLVVVGPGTVGRLRVARGAGGVVERLDLAGPDAGSVPTGTVEAMVDALAPLVRTATVAVHPARRRGLRAPGPSLPALPFGVLIGAEVVGERGAAHALAAPAASVRPAGGGVWCRLDGGAAAPFEQLLAVLAHFGAPLRAS